MLVYYNDGVDTIYIGKSKLFQRCIVEGTKEFM